MQKLSSSPPRLGRCKVSNEFAELADSPFSQQGRLASSTASREETISTHWMDPCSSGSQDYCRGFSFGLVVWKSGMRQLLH